MSEKETTRPSRAARVLALFMTMPVIQAPSGASPE
jgi:hypothetical protein